MITADKYIQYYPVFHVNDMIKKEIVTATISHRTLCIRNKNKFWQATSAVDWCSVFSAPDTQTALNNFYYK